MSRHVFFSAPSCPLTDPLNPYAPPSDLPADAPTDFEQIQFETIVEASDVARVMSRLDMFVGIVMATLLGFAMTMIVLWGSSRSLTSEPELLGGVLFFQVMLILLGVFGWNRFGPGVGRFVVMRDPSVLGTLRGHITLDGMFFRRDHTHGVYWLSSITSLRTNSRGLAVSFDSFRARMFVIPRTAFHAGEFEAAVERLQSHMSRLDPVRLAGFDPRQRVMPEGPLLLSVEDDAIAFEGELLFADLKSTRLQTQLLAGKVLLLILGCIGMGGGVAIALLANSLDKISSVMGFGVGAFFLFHWLRLHRDTRKDQVVGVSKGVVDQNGIIDCTAIGQVHYGWWMFQWCVIQDDIVLMRTRGLTQYYVVVVKREFPSTNDWERVLSLIRENVVIKQR